MTMQKLIIIGNLGSDPELKQFNDGGSITTVSVAASEKWKDKQGNPQEHTEWFRCVFSGRLAEIASQYLRKGSKVYIEGKQRTRMYQDKQTGEQKSITETRVLNMQMLDSKDEGQSNNQPSYQRQPSNNSYQNGNQQAQPNNQPPQFNNQMSGANVNQQNNSVPIDEIPF